MVLLMEDEAPFAVPPMMNDERFCASASVLIFGGVPSVTDAEIRRHGTDPRQLREFEIELLGLRQRRGDQPGAECRDHRSVLGRIGVEVTHRHQGARARHVLNDDRGLAGDISADVSGNEPRIGIVAAAGRKTDDDGDRLAPVEVGVAPRGCGRRQRRQKRQAGYANDLSHGVTSVGGAQSRMSCRNHSVGISRPRPCALASS